MAERLGYAPADLDRVPQDAIDSFAGVGYFFHLADLKPGEHVVDLGSGSGMDTFVASLKVGPTGRVVGVDMTDAQLAKAERLARSAGFDNVTYRKAYIEDTGLDAGTFDCVISNGVINLAADKDLVFQEAARLLEAAGASPSPTSSPNCRCLKASCATRISGRRASAVPRSRTSTARPSKPRACASSASRRTRSISSSPTTLGAPWRNGA